MAFVQRERCIVIYLHGMSVFESDFHGSYINGGIGTGFKIDYVAIFHSVYDCT